MFLKIFLQVKGLLTDRVYEQSPFQTEKCEAWFNKLDFEDFTSNDT